MTTRLARSVLAIFMLSMTALAHFGEGQIWVIDRTNSKVYLVDSENGFVVTEVPLATSMANLPGAIGFNLAGRMLVANTADDEILEFDGLGGATTVLTSANGLSGPMGSNAIVIGPGLGDVYVSNWNTSQILKFDSNYGSGTVFADAADGIVHPSGMAFLPDGDLLIANRDSGGNVLHIDGSGNVSTFVTIAGDEPMSILSRDNFDLYVLTVGAKLFRYIGGDPNNVVELGTYGPPNAEGGLSFDHHEAVIYHINNIDGLLRAIDPDTGAVSVVATLPGAPNALMEVGTQYAPGTFYLFGKPFPGIHPEPLLVGLGEPRIGQPATIQSHDWFGGSLVFIFLSMGMTETTFKGGEFHIDFTAPSWVFQFTAPGAPGAPVAGDIDLPFTVPNVPSMVGMKFYMQAVGTHPPAPFGVALTKCLTMYVGI